MKRLFRWLFRLLILAIVLSVALVLLKDTLLKALAEWQIRRATGLSVTIEKLEAGLFAPTLRMEGFKLYNPPELGGTLLLDIPEVSSEYDAGAALGGKLHLKLLRVRLSELHIVKGRAAQTNLSGLFAPGTPKPAGEPRPAAAAKLPVEFGGIDRLYLSLGTVKYTDLQQPANNWQRTLNWQDRQWTNSLKTPGDLVGWAMLMAWQVQASPVSPAPR